MKIQPNSRQIPSIERYTANDSYDDLLYGLLQTMSYSETIDGDAVRYVDKKDVTFTKLAPQMGLSRQKVSEHFKQLIELGLVEEDLNTNGKKRYKLINLDMNVASLVGVTTLQAMIDSLSHYSISIYVYCLKRYIANKEKPFITTHGQLKSFIGAATTTSSNNHIIVNVLNILAKIGLINWMYEDVEDKAGNKKTIIKILEVSNTIK